jgi:anti-anti-sigma factor
MTFTCREVSEVWVIALEGKVDPGTVIALQRKINRALDSGSGGVVIDLGAVSVGAQTLSLFCGALRRLRGGAVLAIVGADPRVRRVLELCAIDQLALYPTINDALAAADDRAMQPLSPADCRTQAGQHAQAQVGAAGSRKTKKVRAPAAASERLVRTTILPVGTSNPHDRRSQLDD